MDRRLKLRHFQCFIEVAQSNHLTDAAKSLNITQAAVSKTLTELEAIVGAKLLSRDRRGVSLTSQGELFFHYASAGLASLENGYEGLTGGPNTPQIELRIGVLPTVAARFMPSAIKQFSIDNMRPVNISLQTGYNHLLLDLLHSGKTDLAIARIGSPEMMRELEFTHLYSESLVLVARSDHALFELTGRSRLAEVAKYPFLLPPKDISIRPIVEQALITLGIGMPTTVIETISNTFGRAFLRGSDAVWMISYGVVVDYLNSGVLRLLTDPIENTKGPVGLIRREDQEVDVSMRQLTSILLQQTRHLRDAVN
ncbi:pca operon transcription factor PcaQ [Natronospirillum operosum]|uniref:Pca operon transcription factor PcaQ n=1 Tax=Natronospirillum operosum TaxID=2759953 RepID=A0A4Z0WGH8_9GAMM|nr:pca operon transcription factor PcaQ [Natronospirillum operosum]TGG95057.1 pca operon transcription factor PcaQ [Natronospirillum operosum]